MKKVVIVGGGLAGLAAAYEISKKQCFDLTLIEKENEVGGRIKSILLQDQYIDVGGFVIYPWYKQFYRLIGELGLQDHLKKIKEFQFMYQLDPGEVFKKEENLTLPLREKINLILSMLPDILQDEFDFSNPQLDLFENQTVREFIQKHLGEDSEYAKFIDTIHQGYCYGSIDKHKMSLLAPILYQISFAGDISSSSSFDGNTQMVTQALSELIMSNKGKLLLNSGIAEVDASKKILTMESGKKIEYDFLVLASNVQEFYKTVIPAPIEIEYTRHYAVVAKVNKKLEFTEGKSWGAAFGAPENEMSVQVISAININDFNDSFDEQHIIAYIAVNDLKIKDLVEEDIKQLIVNWIEETFDLYCKIEIADIHHWKQTMPIAQEEFISAVRDQQEKNDIYFAGDFLGSPSMETAIVSGVKVSEKIIKLCLK